MDFDAQFAEVLRRLAAGELDPGEWLAWWNRESAAVATKINRGQWIRLKPPSPGGFGPPSRCAFVSQSEACKLLDKWGVPYEFSNRYEVAWEREYQEFRQREDRKRKEMQVKYGPVLKALSAEFPKFVRFLRRDLEVLELLEPAAETSEVAALEVSLGARLPAAYQRFLQCCRAVELGDALKFGLPQTFLHEARFESAPLSGRMLCFGDCWLEADGDQVLFPAAGEDRPIFYYAHENAELRQVALGFSEWVEGVPKWDVWDS